MRETAPSAEVGTLISFAPAPGPIGHLLRTAIDAEQVGGTRLHLAAGQPGIAAAVAALREQTQLIVTCDNNIPGVDVISSGFVDAVVDDRADLPGVVAEVARLVRANADGVAIYGRGRATLPALLAALAAGGHIWVEAPEHEAAQRSGGQHSAGQLGAGQLGGGQHVGGPGPHKDHAALVARASGLARIAGRPPLDRRAARRLLGIG